MFRLEQITKTYAHRRWPGRRAAGCVPGDRARKFRDDHRPLRLRQDDASASFWGAWSSPTSGRVVFQETDLYRLSPARLAEVRNRRIGFVLRPSTSFPT